MATSYCGIRWVSVGTSGVLTTFTCMTLYTFNGSFLGVCHLTVVLMSLLVVWLYLLVLPLDF